jgi:hypothetical protein
MTSRSDISDKVIHFTNGDSEEDSFANLRKIVGDRRLVAGNRMVRGSYRCVSFTEAPIDVFRDCFVRNFPYSRYSEFGLMFDKAWVFAHGGRPVIYQPDSDFDILPEELRWRHVRYEPIGEQVVDFTWEREWRMHCNELPFSPAEAQIIVPNAKWASAFRRIHHAEREMTIELYATVMERQIAEQLHELFQWHITYLHRLS